MSTRKKFQQKAGSDAQKVLTDFVEDLKLAAQDVGVSQYYESLGEDVTKGRTFQELALDNLIETYAMVMRKADPEDVPLGFFLQAMKERDKGASITLDDAKTAIKSKVDDINEEVRQTKALNLKPVPEFLQIASERGDQNLVKRLVKGWERVLDGMSNLTLSNSALEAVYTTEKLKKAMATVVNKQLLTRRSKVNGPILDANGNAIEDSSEETRKKLNVQQRLYMLQAQKDEMLAEEKKLKEVLGLTSEDDEDDVARFKRLVDEKSLSPDAYKRATKEIKRLEGMNPASQESQVILTYLERLFELPWGELSEVNNDVNAAQARLDADHYGMDKVKESIVERIATMNQTGTQAGTILCLQGPPGVGKTSIGTSIADATGREFVKVSLGGVRDEADIRGHRVTYVGAMPGRIIDALQKSGVDNPLMLLDEIDKMSTGGGAGGGDPTAAMLEVLDPSQNSKFKDHYMGVEYDLSNVMFIATSNYLENVPAPLRDRMEIIELPGYTPSEKREIASRYLVGKQMKNTGLTDKNIEFTDDGIMAIINGYTMEAGVRKLEQTIGKICRKVVRQLQADKGAFQKVSIDENTVKEYLGEARDRKSDLKDRVGYVNGLYYSAGGGGLLPIQVGTKPTANGKPGTLKIKGNLEKVMTESAESALFLVQKRAKEFGIDPKDIENRDIFIRPEEGAIKKDGPSAGAAMTLMLVSEFTGIPVRGDVALTGEINFTDGGLVAPIGGVREKLVGALTAGMKTVIIPEANKKDLDEVPQEIKNALEIIPVKTIDEVLEIALTEELKPIAPDVTAEASSPLADFLNRRIGEDDLERAKDAGGLNLKVEFSKGGKPLLEEATIPSEDPQTPGRKAQLRP